MKHWTVGIDGGGTKTKGVLFDETGRDIASHVSGPGNISVDETNTIRSLEAILDHLMAIPDDVTPVIQIGLAGYANYPRKDKLRRHLEARHKTIVRITDDAVLALYSVKKDADADTLMILSGTGSVVVTETSGTIRYFGGFGHILGDEGSAYHTVIQACRDIIRTHEENREPTPFQTAFLDAIDAHDYTDIKSFVYNQAKGDVARMARFIAERGEQGDADASALIDQAGKHLAELAIRAYRVMPHGQTVLIGFRGGFIRRVSALRESVIRHLTSEKMQFILEDEVIEPVRGAYHMAKKLWETRKRHG